MYVSLRLWGAECALASPIDAITLFINPRRSSAGGTSKAVLAIRSSLNLYDLQSSVIIGYSCFLLKGVRQKRPIMDNNENGNAAFSECRSEVVNFQAGLMESFCGVRTTRSRMLPECALPDIRLPYAHTPGLGTKVQSRRIRPFLWQAQENVHSVPSVLSMRSARARASSTKVSS